MITSAESSYRSPFQRSLGAAHTCTPAMADDETEALLRLEAPPSLLTARSSSSLSSDLTASEEKATQSGDVSAQSSPKLSVQLSGLASSLSLLLSGPDPVLSVHLSGGEELIAQGDDRSVSHDEIRLVLNTAHGRLASVADSCRDILSRCGSGDTPRCEAETRRLDESILTLVSADPACFQRILADTRQSCTRKQAAARGCELLAEASFAPDLLDTGVLPSIFLQLKCSNPCCRTDALRALKAILLNGTPTTPRHLRCDPDAVQVSCFPNPFFSAKQQPNGGVFGMALLTKGCKQLLTLLRSPDELDRNIQLALSVLRMLYTRHGAASAVPPREAVGVVLRILSSRVGSWVSNKWQTGVPEPDLSLLCTMLYTLDAVLTRAGGESSAIVVTTSIEPLLQLLRFRDPDLVELVVAVLVHFVQASNEHKLTVAQRGGVKVAHWLLSRDPGTLPSQAALQLLLSLSFHAPTKPYFLSTRIFPLLVDLLSVERGAGVVAASGQVIMELVAGNRQCKAAFVSAGVMRALVELVATENPDLEVVAAVVMLAVVCGSDGAKLTAHSNMDEELARLVLRTSDPVCHYAAQLLMK